MNLKRFSLKIFLFFLSIITGLIACEYFARKLGLGNPLLYKVDPLVGYRLKANQNIIRRRGARVSTNNEGFRINHKKILFRDSKYIVFVGDSVTYGGSYIDNSNLFSSKFCNLLDSKYYCLNNGINSWGVINMSRFIAHFDIYSKIIPERIILVILPGDEERNLRAISSTPFWSESPKNPSGINEILRFLIKRHLIPKFEKENNITKNSVIISEEIQQIKSVQRDQIWKEMSFILKNSKYNIQVVITPPKSWFNDKSKKEIINKYDLLLENIKNLKTINKTCNLYHFILPQYSEELYIDGVHLTNKGHNIWANKLDLCLNK